MKWFSVALLTTFCFAHPVWATSDSLGSRTIQIAGPNAEDKLNAAAANLKHVFEQYEPALDDDSEIVTPYAVQGSATNPEISVSIKKCVSFICKTVDLDAMVSIAETKGNCDRNLVLNVDLGQSSEILTDAYSALQANICFHRGGNGDATLDVEGFAIQADGNDGGVIAQQILGLLQLQIDPIVEALKKSL